MTDTNTQSLILWKSSLGFTSTNKEKEFFEETQPFNTYVIGDDIFTDSIPATFEESANTMQFTSSISGTLDITGTVCRLENIELTLIPQSDSDSTSGAWTAKDDAGNIILTNSIQFNTNQVDSLQPYEYRLYNGDVRITPAEGSWVFDVKSGIVKFYGDYGSQLTDLKITCYKYIGKTGVQSVIINQSTDFSRDLKHAVYFDQYTARDLTGNSVVTLHNNPTVNADGLNLVRASTQYATLNETNIGGTITFSMWYNRHIDPGSTYVRLFEFNNSGGSDRMTLYYGKSNPRTIESQVYHGTSSPGSTGEVSVIRPNEAEWHHIVWVIDDNNDTRYMYLDGTLVSSQTGATNAPVKMVRTNNYIGTVGGLIEKCFDGQIKSLNIWERALSANEISDLYDRGRDYSVVHQRPVTIRKNKLHFDNSTKTLLTYHNEWNEIDKITTNSLNKYIKGTTNDGIRFPDSSIPENFTIITVSRFGLPRDETNARTGRKRIFDGVTKNWLHGQYDGYSGFAHYNKWLTYPSSGGSAQEYRTDATGYTDGDWLIMGSRNIPDPVIDISGTNSVGYTYTGHYKAPITISFWFKFNGTTSRISGYVFTTNKNSGGSSNQTYVIRRDHNRNKLIFRREDFYDIYSRLISDDIGDNTWAFITIVIDSSGNAKMYTNGVLSSTSEVPFVDDTFWSQSQNNSEMIFGGPNLQPETDIFVPCSFRDINIKYSALTDAEVSNLYNTMNNTMNNTTIDGINKIANAVNNYGGEGNEQLSINDGISTPATTAWEVREVLIWDGHLTQNQFEQAYVNLNLEVKPGDENDWVLSTEISHDDPINNPWTGEGEEGAPPVEVPLNTLSHMNGEDLEIKMEIDVPAVNKIRVEINIADWGDYATNSNNVYYGATSSQRCLTVAEVKVYNQENVNVATGATSQSTTHSSYPSSNVIDGNTGTFNHTNIGEDAWLEVELSSLSVVSSIEITQRQGTLLTGSSTSVNPTSKARVPTRIKLLDSNDNVLKTIVPTSWSTLQQTFTFTEQEQQNEFTSTITRFYKGWRLDEVFDYPKAGGTSRGVDAQANAVETLLYYKKNEYDPWISNSGVVNSRFGWHWIFQAIKAPPASGGVPYADWYTIGMLTQKRGDSGETNLNINGIWYEKHKIRVYAKLSTSWPQENNMIGWYHASTFGSGNFGAEWVNSAPSSNKLASATVTRGTVTTISDQYNNNVWFNSYDNNLYIRKSNSWELIGGTQQNLELETKANIESPSFTGDPRITTVNRSLFSNSIVTKENVDDLINDNLLGSSTSTTFLDTLRELQDAINTNNSGDDLGAYFDGLIDNKANIDSPSFTGTIDFANISITGLTKSHFGLSNVDNTSDNNKPCPQSVTDLANGKIDASTIDFTNKTINITKSDIGLGNVDENMFEDSPLDTATLADDISSSGISIVSESSNSTRISSYKYLNDQFISITGNAPSSLNTIEKISNSLNDNANFKTDFDSDISIKLSKTRTDDLQIGTVLSSNANDSIKLNDSKWLLVTELRPNDYANNPYTGAGFPTAMIGGERRQGYPQWFNDDWFLFRYNNNTIIRTKIIDGREVSIFQREVKTGNDISIDEFSTVGELNIFWRDHTNLSGPLSDDALSDIQPSVLHPLDSHTDYGEIKIEVENGSYGVVMQRFFKNWDLEFAFDSEKGKSITNATYHWYSNTWQYDEMGDANNKTLRLDWDDYAGSFTVQSKWRDEEDPYTSYSGENWYGYYDRNAHDYRTLWSFACRSKFNSSSKNDDKSEQYSYDSPSDWESGHGQINQFNMGFRLLTDFYKDSYYYTENPKLTEPDKPDTEQQFLNGQLSDYSVHIPRIKYIEGVNLNDSLWQTSAYAGSAGIGARNSSTREDYDDYRARNWTAVKLYVRTDDTSYNDDYFNCVQNGKIGYRNDGSNQDIYTNLRTNDSVTLDNLQLRQSVTSDEHDGIIIPESTGSIVVNSTHTSVSWSGNTITTGTINCKNISVDGDCNVTGWSASNISGVVNADRLPNNIPDHKVQNYPGNFLTYNHVGMIVAYWGSDNGIPNGWKLCNGQNGTPNLDGNYPLGTTRLDRLGIAGGSNSIVLTKNNLPSHRHTWSDWNPGGTSSADDKSGGHGAVTEGHQNAVNLEYAGKTNPDAIENRPSSIKVRYIMFTGT